MLYKSIAYAYPSSINASVLGFEDGCWYVEHRYTGANQRNKASFIAYNCEGFDTPDHTDLITLYHEYEGVMCPMFKTHGNAKALVALGVNVPQRKTLRSK